MRKKMLSLLLVLILSLTGCSFSTMSFENNPSKHIMYSLINTSMSTAVNADIEVTMNVNEDKALNSPAFMNSEDPQVNLSYIKFISSVLDELNIKSNTNISLGQNSNSIFDITNSTSFNYMDKPIINANISILDSILAVDIPQLHENTFYMYLEELNELQNQLKGLKILEYRELFFKEDGYTNLFEKNAPYYEKTFANFINSRLKGSSTSTITTDLYGSKSDLKVTNYELELGLMDILDLEIKLLEQAKYDMELKNLFIARLDDVKEMALANNDYEKFEISKEEFISGMDELKIELSSYWESSIQEIIDSLNLERETIDTAGLPSSITMIISIDNSNKIRKVEYDLNIDIINMHETVVYNGFDSDVKLNQVKDLTNAIDINELNSSPEKYEGITKTINQNLINNILRSPNFTNMIDDIKSKSNVLPELERNIVIESLNIDTLIESIEHNSL